MPSSPLHRVALVGLAWALCGFDIAPGGTAPSGSQLIPDEPATPEHASRPERPSRRDVLLAVKAAQSAFEACGRLRQPGDPKFVQIVYDFASDGFVAAAWLREPETVSKEAGECALAAAKTMMVPPFRAPSVRVSMAFRLDPP